MVCPLSDSEYDATANSYPSIIFLVANEKICELFDQLDYEEMPGEDDDDETPGEKIAFKIKN